MPLIITAAGNICNCPLTTRERNVLDLLAKGLRQRRIAQELSISLETVKKHIKNAYKKLGAHNKVEALRISGML